MKIITFIARLIASTFPGSVNVEALTPWHGWADFVVNADMSLGMGWGATPEEAEQKALKAGRKKSLSCAEVAALTYVPTNRVALVCCRHDEMAYVVGIGGTNEDAVSKAEAFADGQGWGRCSVRELYSARTGFKS
jgi:hypothetical protein